jgi:uncharacterized protein YbaP (TraB family)
MKRRLSWFWFLTLACAWPVLAAEPTPASTNALHSLWRVEGRSNVVYLLGSVHLLKEKDYPLAPVIESAFSNSAVAVFETELEKMDQLETQQKIMARAALPAGETLTDHLSPAVYAEFSKKLEQAGLPAATFDRLRPSIAALTLVVMEFLRLGADPDLGIDRHFFKLAQESGKRVAPLESIDFQVRLITEFTREEGEALMKSTLEQIDETRKLYPEMVAAWKRGDGSALEKMLNDAMRDAPAIYRRLLTDRNERWVPQIQRMIDGGTNTIVIVGAGHLVGSEGVVELLRKKGARIKQL